ncbi:hypothetical protein WME98_04960 [Sorangium sp. So ce296]|uniref:hypothetical protein n=1 Tax=Sorangium sp. So ce296 TaxID=3133296 RepID=UPI003F62315C
MASGDGISFIELVVLGWSSATAAPTPIPIRVDFDAPADCATVDDLYEAIHARSDRVRKAEDGEGGWGLRVRLTRGGSGVHGELRVIHERGETDTRTVDATSCEVVVQALSLTAALALDEAAEETAPLPPPPPPAPPPPRPVQPPPAAPRPWPPITFGVGAQLLVTQVVSPYASLGGALVARATAHTDGALSPSLGLSLNYARNDILQGTDNALIHWAAAALTACPLRWQIADFLSAEPCVVVTGGWFTATAEDVSHPRSAVRSWWSAGALARAAVPLGGGTAIEIEVGAGVPLVRRSFTISLPAETVGETPVISPLAGVGIVHSF